MNLYQWVWPQDDSAIVIPWWGVVLLVAPGLLAALDVFGRAWTDRLAGSGYDRPLDWLLVALDACLTLVVGGVISTVCVIAILVVFLVVFLRLGVESPVGLGLVSLLAGWCLSGWLIQFWLKLGR